MDIKQPTNSRTREAMEQFIRQKDENGLYNYSLFHALDGSDFLQDYQLFSEGKLTGDQADQLLRDTLRRQHIAHMRVVHPQLDIEAMVMHLARDRCERKSNQALKAFCTWHREFQPLRLVDTQAFDPLKGTLVIHATKTVPLAIALGQPKDVALKHLVKTIDEGLNALEFTADRYPHIRTGFLHHFLIAYPELWRQTNTEPYHFLGEPMIRIMPGGGMRPDRAVIEGPAGKSLIRCPGWIPLELIFFTLDYLVGIDSDVLDAKHLLREGTRSEVWLDRCPNLEEGLPIIERLLACGVVHPAIERIEGIAAKLSEAGKRAALLCYAKGSDAISSELAQAIVEVSPESYDQVFVQVKKFPYLQRLTNLKWPSDEQLLKLSPKTKRLLLEGDLGI
ncbi:conserved hypothetical protein [Pseudomonas sp. 9AZ]|uniref:hypothetical protein n=1 Tax=Pseudomonas sp. 9AZ TaxID=2653168 RepID=UPI0012F3157D|nr:hypothetical protein [Pseudomonas sp. 9AZ]VXD00358.1 conserved hypothetical protein [Pseudomonas sp. 9AZ]